MQLNAVEWRTDATWDIMAPLVQDIKGQRFGKLTAIEPMGKQWRIDIM